MSADMKEFYKKLGIELTPSTAYHPTGNQLAEGTIHRVKRALMGKIYSQAIMDILALNMNPRRGQVLSPFESLHSIVSLVSGIPMKPDREKFLTNRNLIEQRITEHPNLNLKADNNTCPKPTCCHRYSDLDQHTREENTLDKNWTERISNTPTDTLESGDRVYFVRRGGKGHGKWKRGLVMGRATDVEIN